MATARVDNVSEYWEAAAVAAEQGAAERLGLRIQLDLDNDRRRIYHGILFFADNAGLEAEFDAGAATTVLDAAIDTHLAAVSEAEPLSATQHSYIGSELAY